MIAKEALLRLLDGLSEAEVEELVATLESQSSLESHSRTPRPLRRDDIVRNEPIMPDDETADEMIQAVRQWRRAGGYV